MSKPTKSQQRVINAMARGSKLWLHNEKGSGCLTRHGIQPSYVSANDMTRLLYDVQAIERDHEDPLIDGDYKLTEKGKAMALSSTPNP